MLPAETEDLPELVYVGGEILAEDEDITTRPPSSLFFTNHVERRRPKRGRALYNPCFFHGGELGLGGGELHTC